MTKFITGLIVVFVAILLLVSCRQRQTASELYRNINVTEAKILLQQGNIYVLDVRTPDEYKAGTIDRAVNIDVQNADFVERISTLDKEQTYVVFCRSGRRSVTASKLMTKNGFKHIINMKGGYTAWTKE